MNHKKINLPELTATSSISTHDGLVQRSLHGIKWNYLGVAGRIGAQLITQIALARMLGPETFGIFATSVLIIGLGLICIEMGLGSALVQTKNIDDLQIRHAFTMLVAAGTIGSIIIFLMAGHIASFFNNAQLEIVLQAMAPILTIQALGVISQALLRREFAFKIIQMGQLSSYIVSYALIGTGLAWYGAGIWSLVAAWHIQGLLTCLIFFWKSPHSVKPLFGKSKGQLQSFGVKILFTNVVNWITENVDNLIIGNTLGATILGLYSVSYNLVRTPANHLVISLQTVLFPASACAQDNMSALQRAYLSVIAGVTLIACPIFITISALSATVIEALFGDRWAAAAPIIVALALAMAVHPMMAVAGPMLAGKGRPEIELKVQFWIALVFIGLLLMASRVSIQAVAWSVFAIYVVRAIWITFALLKSFNIPLSKLFRALQGSMIITVILVPIVLLIDKVMISAAQPASYRLFTEIISSSFITLVLLFVIPSWILSTELRLIIGKLSSRSAFLNDSFFMRRIKGGNF